MQDFIRLEGSLKAQELLKGHAFTTPVVQWVLGCLSGCQFEGVPPLLHSFLESTWSSLLNSKLVEDGNKIQREEEQRGTTSKKVSPQQGWFCLTQHKLLAKNHRNEIKATEQLRVPKDWDINSLFQHTRARQGITEEELADEKFLREILGKVTWPTHNPQSEQEHFSDFALLQKLQRVADPWGCLETSWWASFCPEGHVVEQAGHPALVIRAYKRGCLVVLQWEHGELSAGCQPELAVPFWRFHCCAIRASQMPSSWQWDTLCEPGCDCACWRTVATVAMASSAWLPWSSWSTIASSSQIFRVWKSSSHEWRPGTSLGHPLHGQLGPKLDSPRSHSSCITAQWLAAGAGARCWRWNLGRHSGHTSSCRAAEGLEAMTFRIKFESSFHKLHGNIWQNAETVRFLNCNKVGSWSLCNRHVTCAWKHLRMRTTTISTQLYIRFKCRVPAPGSGVEFPNTFVLWFCCFDCFWTHVDFWSWRIDNANRWAVDTNQAPATCSGLAGQQIWKATMFVLVSVSRCMTPPYLNG